MTTDQVISKIISFRNKKGYTYENMSEELNITPAAYRKIEIGETRLSLDRFFKIAEILECPIKELLQIDGNSMQQHNHNNENVYQQRIENFYNENIETYKNLILSKDEQIFLLKEQIETLKKILK